MVDVAGMGRGLGGCALVGRGDLSSAFSLLGWGDRGVHGGSFLRQVCFLFFLLYRFGGLSSLEGLLRCREGGELG